MQSSTSNGPERLSEVLHLVVNDEARRELEAAAAEMLDVRFLVFTQAVELFEREPTVANWHALGHARACWSVGWRCEVVSQDVV